MSVTVTSSSNAMDEESSSNPQSVDIDLYADIDEFHLPAHEDENDCLAAGAYEDLNSVSSSSPNRRYGSFRKDTPRPTPNSRAVSSSVSYPTGRSIGVDTAVDEDNDSESSFLHRPKSKLDIFVGNLNWWTTDKDILEALAKIGVTDLVNLSFYENRVTGQSKGYCCLTVGSEASVTLIKESLTKQEICGQIPRVTPVAKHYKHEFEMLATLRSTPPTPGIGGIRNAIMEIGTVVTSRSGFPFASKYGPGTNGNSGNGSTTPMGPPNYDMGKGSASASGPGWHRTPNGHGPSPRRMSTTSPQNSFSRSPFGHGRSGRGSLPYPSPLMYGGGPYGSGPGGMGMGYGRGQLPPSIGDHVGLFPPMDWVCRRPPILMPQFPGVPPPRPHMNPAFFQNLGNSPPGTSRPFSSPPRNLQPPGVYSPIQMHEPLEQVEEMNDVPARAPTMSESEFERVMHRNRAVSSSAISRAVEDVASGDFDSAIETLATAISLIQQSKSAMDARCKVLIESLQDTLHGIEEKSVQSGLASNERSASTGREREQESGARVGRKRSRSPVRHRQRSYSNDRFTRYPRYSGERERGRDYRERSRYESDRGPPTEKRYREFYHTPRYGGEREREVENGRGQSSRENREGLLPHPFQQ